MCIVYTLCVTLYVINTNSVNCIVLYWQYKINVTTHTCAYYDY